MFVAGTNWVDLVILAVLLYYASTAFSYGFLYILGDFVSFFLSLLLSLRLYKFTAELLKNNFTLSMPLSNALGFIVTSILLEVLIDTIIKAIISSFPKKILNSKINKFLGIAPALGEGLLLISFLLTAVVALPVRPDVKKEISQSKVASFILKETAGAEKQMNKVFGGAINDALTYFTIDPGSKQTIQLQNTNGELSVDEAAETKMLNDLNHERVSRELSPLEMDTKYRGIARDYARDMWTRHYFSHYNPEGKSVADRFDAAGIKYEMVGENLALAPTEETAHTGLMNSEGHRANILEPKFKKVGIGVIDNGIYGKIFVQEFSD